MTIQLIRTATWFNPVTAVNPETGKGIQLKSIVFYNDSNAEVLKINGGWFDYPCNNPIDDTLTLTGSFRRKVKNWKENYVCGETLYIYNLPIAFSDRRLVEDKPTYQYWTRDVKFTICEHEIKTHESPYEYVEKENRAKYESIRKRIKNEIWVDVYEDKIDQLYEILKEELG